MKKIWLDIRFFLIDRAYKTLSLAQRQHKELKAMAKFFNPAAFRKYNHAVEGRAIHPFPFRTMEDLTRRLKIIHQDTISHRVSKASVASPMDVDITLDAFFLSEAGNYVDELAQVESYMEILDKILNELDILLEKEPTIGKLQLNALITLFGRLKRLTKVLLYIGV